MRESIGSGWSTREALFNTAVESRKTEDPNDSYQKALRESANLIDGTLNSLRTSIDTTPPRALTVAAPATRAATAPAPTTEPTPPPAATAPAPATAAPTTEPTPLPAATAPAPATAAPTTEPTPPPAATAPAPAAAAPAAPAAPAPATQPLPIDKIAEVVNTRNGRIDVAADTPRHDEARRQIAAILNRSREDGNRIQVPEEGQPFTPEQRQALNRALREFQTAQRIGVDGVVGRETLNALARAAEVENAIDTAALSRVTRGLPPGQGQVPRDINLNRLGQNVTDTRIVDALKAANSVVNRLSVSAGLSDISRDDTLTVEEIKAFQRAYGLRDDGVIGGRTTRALEAAAALMNNGVEPTRQKVDQALSAPPATPARTPAPTERS